MDNAGGMKAYPTRAGDYKFLEECGHGVSAIVYRALCVPLNEIVAIKVLDLEKCSSNLDEIRREATTMSLINHPNVVRAYCSFVVNQNLWVVMPFLSGGSCLHVMKAAFPEGFEELVIATILKETLKALEYLHRHGHIHRDVKAGNILIDSNGAVKLADFGVSACMFDTGDRQKSRQTFVGTPCWMAPEVMEQIHGYDFKADIWSFGITALELAHGHAPFSKYPPMKVLLMTLQHEPPGLNLDRDKRFTKSFKEMIASCLVKDPSKRPPVEKLLKHPFFKQAKSADYLVRHVLQGLPPLGERVKALKIKDQARMAAKMMPLGEQEEVSHNEYKRGVSSWNFSIEDLKQQAKDEEEDGGSSQAPSSDEGSFGRGAGGGGMVSSKGGTSAGGGSSRGTRGSHSDAESDPSPSMEGSPRQAQHRTHAMMSSTVHPAPLSTASAAAASALNGDKGEKGLMAGAMDSRDGGGAGAAAPAGGGGGYAGAGPMRGRTSRGPTPPPMQNVQMLIIGGESQNGHKFLSGNGGGGGGLFSPKTGEVQQQHQSMYGGSGGGGGGGSSTTGVIVVRKEGVVKHVGRFDVEIAERTSPPQQQHQPGGAAGAQRSIVMERLEAVTVTSAVPIGGEVGERSSRHSSGLERVAIENRTALEQREREHRGSLGNLSFFDKDRDRPLANGVPSSSAAGAGGAPRGAAASAGATPSKDAEQSQVVRKGRFSVTPGNVEDVESTLPIPPKRPNAGAAVKAAQQAPQSSQVHRSPSINDWSAQSGGGADRRSSLNPSSSPSPPIVNHPAATTASAGGGGGLLVPVVNVLPHLQNMMHHVICEQDLLLNLMNCLSANDPSALCRSKVSSMGSRESAEHGGDVTDRERDLLRQVMELQSRVAALTEQLELVKGKNVQLERKLNTIFNEEEERRIHAEERDRSPDND